MPRLSQIAALRQGVTQEITTGSESAAASNAFGAQTYCVRLSATAACRFRIGNGSVTAAATDSLLPANVVDYIVVSPGQKIAAIEESDAGKLSVTEMI